MTPTGSDKSQATFIYDVDLDPPDDVREKMVKSVDDFYWSRREHPENHPDHFDHEPFIGDHMGDSNIASKKDFDENNSIVLRSWHKNKLDNCVIQKTVCVDSKGKCIESHVKEHTRRSDIHALMNGSMNIQHSMKELIQHSLHARSTQALDFWYISAPEVLHISIVAPAEVRNFPRAVTPEVKHIPMMSEPAHERWHNNVEGAQEEDSSSTEIEPDLDIEFNGTQENP